MYAIIDDKGRQFKVSEGDEIDIDLREAMPGDVIEFDKILFCSADNEPLVGTPIVANAKVSAEVQAEIKGKKTIHFPLRRRKASRRKVGHRQRYLRVRITEISAG